MKYLKKYIYVLITVILICVSFAGCSSETVPEEITADTVTEAISATEHSLSAKKTDTTKSIEKETTSKRARTDNKNDNTATASATDKTTAKQTTAKKEENKTTAKKPAKTTVTTSSSVTCSIEIECKQVLNNMDKLKAGHEDFVPADGIIMSTQTITVDKSSTVYDVLKSACSKGGIAVNAEKSAYGTYIKGFNNIDEFDCGKQSGWVYTVNGSSPPKSCDKYTVSQGDSIVFSFVC